tara:strand:+ start:587 stop:724 length:138 start_codon:yes stop_codon:yes gene_type:complete
MSSSILEGKGANGLSSAYMLGEFLLLSVLIIYLFLKVLLFKNLNT